MEGNLLRLDVSGGNRVQIFNSSTSLDVTTTSFSVFVMWSGIILFENCRSNVSAKPKSITHCVVHFSFL